MTGLHIQVFICVERCFTSIDDQGICLIYFLDEANNGIYLQD